MKRNLCLILLAVCTIFQAQAQDLRCNIQINADQIQLSDKTIFRKLENALREFMNNRKWTNDKVQDNERIDCNILITVNEFALPGTFKANAQIQSRRTTFNSNYSTQVLNFNDENWYFVYSEFQPLEYSEGQNISNLTSLLAYYAYIIIGMDYDTYALEGGTPHFTKAQNIVNICQAANEPGWKSNESKGSRNRFALMENIFNPRFAPMRKALYTYHRNGLDLMHKNVEEGRDNISKSLIEIQKVFKIAPNSIFLKAFFDAKADELINIYKGLPSQPEKQKMVEFLSSIDIANINRYQNILKN
ncbi:MAG: DUF4835 family protein [Bacteroidia bacterium]|nr:DUF4835 family protein [Bacteroidia bacterium]MBP7259858.1 DUF4835 family protein [Bacteroidia bacterium]MBP9179202.1 DUF4835 family protein [Bacteroidia bacterium]MBP9723503.1 DUF4835 family protein [Bacteroidia bacterium]